MSVCVCTYVYMYINAWLLLVYCYSLQWSYFNGGVQLHFLPDLVIFPVSIWKTTAVQEVSQIDICHIMESLTAYIGVAQTVVRLMYCFLSQVAIQQLMSYPHCRVYKNIDVHIKVCISNTYVCVNIYVCVYKSFSYIVYLSVYR